jgi:penicillin-binding protein 2
MLLENPDHPMQNRCIQNSYAPGSIFKLIMAEAGLSEGVVDGTTSVFCTGSEVYYGRTYHCGSREGHGRVLLEEAIAHSCNIFFYELGKKLGISRIAKHAVLFGLNEKTGIDLPGERSGNVPDEAWKRRTTGEPWYLGETLPVSIGQGALTATPLQIVRAVSALANGGYLVTPHLLLKTEAGDNMEPWPRRRISLDPGNIERIKEGMWRGVNDWGTGHNAAVAGRDIFGKTGTAQVMSKESEKMFPGASRDHAWFAGFSGRDNPDIAVVVFLENGGKGGVVAAPMARKIFEAFYRDGE